MKKVIAVLLAVCLVVGLCSCGSKGMDYSKLTPAANVAILDVDPGMVRDGDTTSDFWYPNGEKGDEYIYFTKASSDSGRAYTKVYADGHEDSAWCINQDEHLIQGPDDTIQIDIVFYDEFTAYDYVSETWYARGVLDDMKALVVGKTFADDSLSITFNEDGTTTSTLNGMDDPGTWRIVNATQVEVTPDSYSPIRYDLGLTNGSVDSITEYWAGSPSTVLQLQK